MSDLSPVEQYAYHMARLKQEYTVFMHDVGKELKGLDVPYKVTVQGTGGGCTALVIALPRHGRLLYLANEAQLPLEHWDGDGWSYSWDDYDRSTIRTGGLSRVYMNQAELADDVMYIIADNLGMDVIQHEGERNLSWS